MLPREDFRFLNFLSLREETETIWEIEGRLFPVALGVFLGAVTVSSSVID